MHALLSSLSYIYRPFPIILLFQGGEIGINIEWKCNLDLSIDYCVPKYSFTRLDAPFAKNAVSKGFNFRWRGFALDIFSMFVSFQN